MLVFEESNEILNNTYAKEFAIALEGMTSKFRDSPVFTLASEFEKSLYSTKSDTPNSSHLLEKLARIKCCHSEPVFVNQVKPTISSSEDRYFQEKSRGGTNSYKDYSALRIKVNEIFNEKLNEQKYASYSTLRLCKVVAKVIEDNYPELLENFKPYLERERLYSWLEPTFYRWCIEAHKDFKARNKAI